MSNSNELNRRAFLRSVGMTALAGATGAGSSLALGAEDSARTMKSGFDFSQYSRIGTDSSKWDRQIKRFGAGTMKVGMGTADMDFRAAPCIGEAIAKRAEHKNWGYFTMPDSYPEAIAAWNGERHGIDVDPKSIVISTGVHPALIAALNTFNTPDTKVLLMTPTYSGFYSDLRWSRTRKNESQLILRDDGRYEIDWDDLEARMTPDTHSILLCNPQNPTGNMWSADDLLRLGRLCLENQVVVLSDEIHCDFVMQGHKYTPFASLPDKAVVDNSVTFKAISKTFSLAAMKNAYFFSTNPVYLERIKANHRPNINTLGVVANEAAYRHGGPWFDELLPHLEANHELVVSYTKERMPMVNYTKPEGTYLAWLEVSKVLDAIGANEMAAASQATDTPMTAEEVLEIWLVDNAGVHLNPGTRYGAGGEGHIRMNLGAPRKTIMQALDGMSAALNNV